MAFKFKGYTWYIPYTLGAIDGIYTLWATRWHLSLKTIHSVYSLGAIDGIYSLGAINGI